MTAPVKKEVARLSITLGATILLLFCSGIGGYGPCGPGSVIGAICLCAALVMLLLNAIFFGFVVNTVMRGRKMPNHPAEPTSPSRGGSS